MILQAPSNLMAQWVIMWERTLHYKRLIISDTFCFFMFSNQGFLELLSSKGMSFFFFWSTKAFCSWDISQLRLASSSIHTHPFKTQDTIRCSFASHIILFDDLDFIWSAGTKGRLSRGAEKQKQTSMIGMCSKKTWERVWQCKVLWRDRNEKANEWVQLMNGNETQWSQCGTKLWGQLGEVQKVKIVGLVLLLSHGRMRRFPLCLWNWKHEKRSTLANWGWVGLGPGSKAGERQARPKKMKSKTSLRQATAAMCLRQNRHKTDLEAFTQDRLYHMTCSDLLLFFPILFN